MSKIKYFYSKILDQGSRVVVFTIHNFNYSLKLVQSSIQVNIFQTEIKELIKKNICKTFKVEKSVKISSQYLRNSIVV